MMMGERSQKAVVTLHKFDEQHFPSRRSDRQSSGRRAVNALETDPLGWQYLLTAAIGRHGGNL